MLKAKHTALPWEYFKGNANGKGLIRIESGIDARPSGIHIASLTRTPENEANADFIITACNAHEDLVSVAQKALAVLEEVEAESFLRDEIRQALAKAGVNP